MLPESLHVSVDLPESLHVSADIPESFHFSADHPESHHVSADLPESLHITSDHPELRHITADQPESCHVLSATSRYPRSVLQYPRLASSVEDPPLLSVRAQFNLSLSLSVVPSCFKKSIIVPIPKKNKITCLNDWRPVALTPIFSKCFEKLVRDYICSVLPASLDPLQFAYRSNRSTDDAIAFTLHTALSHLENKNTYVRMLFVDYSSAFNTIVPATLVAKFQTLGLNRSLCSWILDFLTGRSQVVRMGNNTSSPLILDTGAPQGCVLSPLLYSLYTHDCTATHSSNVIVKFADGTTVIGLITDNDETAYREEVSTLTKWCQENHLSLNIVKTKELVVDYRRQSREHTPITIDKTPVERVSSFKFLGVHITEDLT